MLREVLCTENITSISCHSKSYTDSCKVLVKNSGSVTRGSHKLLHIGFYWIILNKTSANDVFTARNTVCIYANAVSKFFNLRPCRVSKLNGKMLCPRLSAFHHIIIFS